MYAVLIQAFSEKHTNVTHDSDILDSNLFSRLSHWELGGAVASRLVRSSPDRVVRVRAHAGDIVLCSWARHLTLTVPLSTQVYKWIPADLMLGSNPAMD